MGGIAKRPGSSDSLVNDTLGTRAAPDGPGKRTLTDQLPHAASPSTPAGDVHQAPKHLVPDPNAPPPPRSTILLPDADHPAGRDVDGEQVVQTDKAVAPGTATPLRGTSWKSLAQVSESIDVEDGSG